MGSTSVKILPFPFLFFFVNFYRISQHTYKNKNIQHLNWEKRCYDIPFLTYLPLKYEFDLAGNKELNRRLTSQYKKESTLQNSKN